MPKIKNKCEEDFRISCVNFSLSKNEKDMLAKNADNMGISMSAYIRYKLFYEAPKK